jgi:excisionase family DNA binding protein
MRNSVTRPIDGWVARATTGEPARDYSVGQAASLLGVSPSTVWRWIEAKKLPAYRIGPRRIRIREADLQALIRPARPTKGARAQVQLTIPPPTPEELARRQALVATILQRRQERRISPLTSTELVRQAREEAGLDHDHGR